MLVDFEINLREAVVKINDERQEKVVQQQRRQADVNGAGHGVGIALQRFAQRPVTFKHFACVAERDFAVFGEFERTHRTVKKRHFSETFLKTPDNAAHRRGIHIKNFTGLTDTAGFGDTAEDRPAVQITITLHTDTAPF